MIFIPHLCNAFVMKIAVSKLQMPLFYVQKGCHPFRDKPPKKITERNSSPTEFSPCIHSHTHGHCFFQDQAEQISIRLVPHTLCLAQLYNCTIQLEASLSTLVMEETSNLRMLYLKANLCQNQLHLPPRNVISDRT